MNWLPCPNIQKILCGTGFEWVSSSDGHVPAGGVCAGNQSGEAMYIGRAQIGESLMTGKIHPSDGCIYVPFDGAEHKICQYEALIRSRRCKWNPILQLPENFCFNSSVLKTDIATWVSSSIHAALPNGAVVGGHDVDGSPIYVGRAWHEGDHLPAKVIPSKQAAYVSYDGSEIRKEQYDVMCNGSPIWRKMSSSTEPVPPFSVQAGTTTDGERLYIGRKINWSYRFVYEF